MANSKLTRFKQMFTRFCNDGRRGEYGEWSCGRGGYDQWFEIYYDNEAICDCCAGKCEWYGNQGKYLNPGEQRAIEKIIVSSYEGTRFVKVNEGDFVCVSLKEIYDFITDKERVDEEGNLHILEDGLGIRHYDDYYDLIGDDGNVVCCDGEMCRVEKVSRNGTITLSNEDSYSCTQEFILSEDEADVGIFKM